MTPDQGQHLAAIGAGVVFLVGIVSMVLWRLTERQNRRRNARRFEMPRLLIEDERDDPTIELPAIHYWCPGCGRNAGHNAGCPWIPFVEQLRLRAQQIQIPREGEPS